MSAHRKAAWANTFIHQQVVTMGEDQAWKAERHTLNIKPTTSRMLAMRWLPFAVICTAWSVELLKIEIRPVKIKSGSSACWFYQFLSRYLSHWSQNEYPMCMLSMLRARTCRKISGKGQIQNVVITTSTTEMSCNAIYHIRYMWLVYPHKTSS